MTNPLIQSRNLKPEVKILKTTDGKWWLRIATDDQTLFKSSPSTLIAAIDMARLLGVHIENVQELPLSQYFHEVWA